MLAPVLVALFMLTACSRAVPPAQAQDAADGSPIDARRLALPDAPPPAPANADGKATWRMVGDVAQFGTEQAQPLLTLACQGGRLVITRPIAAEIGAGALFAIEGPKRIIRVPVDATAIPGQRGYIWQGTISADDSRAKVLGGSYNGTLPGAGMIKVSAGAPVRDLIARCRRSAPAATPEPIAPAQIAE